MRIMRVVEWEYNGVWELSAAFVEPDDAEEHLLRLEHEFGRDHLRIVLRKVEVDSEIFGGGKALKSESKSPYGMTEGQYEDALRDNRLK